MTDRTVEIVEQFMASTQQYPHGSYLRRVGGRVEVATGYFAAEHPDRPSPYLHGQPPVFIVDFGAWPWKEVE